MQSPGSPPKPKHNGWWPDVSTPDGAGYATRQACHAAILVTIVTTIMAALGLAGVELLRKMGADGYALIDAGIFAVVAFGLSRRSRVAAWVGLVIYVLDRIFTFGTTGTPVGIVVSIALTLAFIGGVRGTTALHRFKNDPYGTQRMAA